VAIHEQANVADMYGVDGHIATLLAMTEEVSTRFMPPSTPAGTSGFALSQ